MDELNAAPSSTEPGNDPNWTPAQLANIQAASVAPMQINQIVEAGGATSGESSAEAVTAGAMASASQTATANVESAAPQAPISGQAGFQAPNGAPSPLASDAPAIGGGVDAPSHLLFLDAMLAEIERKIGAGIHLFAHEVTAARDHLAKLL